MPPPRNDDHEPRIRELELANRELLTLFTGAIRELKESIARATDQISENESETRKNREDLLVIKTKYAIAGALFGTLGGLAVAGAKLFIH